MANYDAKTKAQDSGVQEFLETVSPPERQTDARRLVSIFKDVTGFPARLWGSAIIGFGNHAVTCERGHSGKSAATGFSPRKTGVVICIMPGYADVSKIFADLGQHRPGKSCLHLKRPDRAHEAALRRLIRAGLDDLARRWPVTPA